MFYWGINMIPTDIDGHVIGVLTATPADLFYGDDPTLQPSVSVRDNYGTQMFIPDFCFDKQGHVLPRKGESSAVCPKEAWIFREVLNALEACISSQPGTPKWHMYIIRRTDKPNHVGILGSGNPCVLSL